MRRCVKLAEGYHYHIFTKSIAGFQIFMSKGEYFRMFNTVQYYQINKIPIPLSRFIRLSGVQKIGVNKTLLSSQGDAKKLVEIIAYCFMPTHIHFILKQSTEDGISNFMRLVLNSYTRYFNIKHKRKGPLWQGRFKNVLIESDEQLYHLTRYIHLNPVTANIAKKPEQWGSSSYSEYINQGGDALKICHFKEPLDIQPENYKRFVNDQINYQKELGIIKNLIVE